MDNEIENVSNQLLGFMEEVNNNILKIMENNSNLTYDLGLKLAEIAVQNQRNDVLWRRLKQISDIVDNNLCELNDNIDELNDNLYFTSDNSNNDN